MTFTPDVSSSHSTNLWRAVGWWCWVWYLAAGTGVLCPGRGTNREAWMSRVSSEGLDSLPSVNWDNRTSLRLGLAEKWLPRMFRTQTRAISKEQAFIVVNICVCWVWSLPRSLQPAWRRYILLPLPLADYLGHWMAQTFDHTSNKTDSKQSIHTGLRKGLYSHFRHQTVNFIPKTTEQLLSYWELLRLKLVPLNN